MNRIKVHRGLIEVAELPLNSSVFDKYLMGRHELAFNFTSPVKLDLRVGDTIEYKGELMTINKEPDITINHLFGYSVSFQGHRHTLERFILKDEGSLVFDYTGQLDDFMFMFLESVNSVDSGWTLGEIEAETELTTISFNKSDSLSALSDIAQAFGCEWQIIGKEISVVKSVGNATTLEFSYGKGNGLYSLSQLRNDQSKIVTRAYAVGGVNNLPAGYAHKQLTLDGFIEDATAVELYGIREGVFEDEDIFPNRTSTATAVAKLSDKSYSITDSTIYFDLNCQRIDGQEAYIVFKSGMLNGQQFKITQYNNATKTIRYEANEDSNGNLIPYSATVAEVGDSYTLIGIRMPSTYVDAAYASLGIKRAEYLNENKHPKVRYELDVDILHLKRLGVEPQEGDLIRLIDDRFNIDVEVRITSISYPGQYDPTQTDNLLTNDIKFKCDLSNDIHYYRVQRIEKEIKAVKNISVSTSTALTEFNRVQSVALSQFKNMVFDPDGNASQVLIDALGAIFGADSQNFDLQGIVFNFNVEGGKVSATAGQLVHHSYSISLGNTWAIPAFESVALDPLKSYYLSAKCSTTALTGEWVLSETPIGTNDETGFYHFNLGVISSEINGERFASITKGYTLITGGQILTERLIAQYLRLPYMTIGHQGENVQRFYYDLAQTKTAVAFGVVNGKPQLVWYDESGVEIWNASKQGIVYVTATPESITQVGMRMLTSIDTQDEEVDPVILHGQIMLNATRVNEYQAYIGNETVYFEYDAGANDNTTANAIYEGYHTMNEKTSPFIPNGMYVFTGISPNYDLILENPDTHELTAHVYRIWQGKVLGSPIEIDFTLPV